MRPALLFIAITVIVGAAAARGAGPDDTAVAVPSTERAQSIVTVRCANCHATLPTFPGVSTAPNGVVFDQPAELKRHAERIGERLANGTMPPGNVTGLTDEEKADLLAWARAARKTGKRR